MQLINRNLKIASAERAKYFKQIGEEIFRPKIAPRTEVTLDYTRRVWSGGTLLDATEYWGE